jgi:membrane protease YdiL (CAAX protease family)
MMSVSVLPIFAILFLLWFLAGAFVYVALIRQIATARSAGAGQSTPSFGLAETILATLLIGFLLINISSALASTPGPVSIRALIASFMLTFAIIMVIVTVLQLRGRSVVALAGLTRLGALRAIVTGTLLLFFAYPLVNSAELFLHRFWPNGFSNQTIVDFFNASQTLEQRITVIIFAVALAPLAEEFLFRFFLYGALKRHFGISFAVLANSFLFAAAHAHLPSFPLLLVLGLCFTIAYEWSGSLLVSMTMHSLFNAISLVALAFPQLLEQ